MMIKLLGIGNSFSWDAFTFIPKILASVGEECKVENLYIGGCSLETHAKNARGNLPAYECVRHQDGETRSLYFKMRDAILSDEWDYISMQQVSGLSGRPESYGDLPYLTDYVNGLKNPSAKLVWHMTWAYKAHSTNEGLAFYNNDQMTMYRAVVSAVQNVVLPLGVFEKVIPNGTAVQNARTSFVGDNLTRDTFHLSMDFGRYIAGLCFVETLLGISPDDVSFVPDGIDRFRLEVARESVKNALKTPFDVTPSAFACPAFSSGKQ
ncbi:MAG: DUF4886 domain-containing protein [Clostridia bacterium]|nr:DUF4886 domain-containing protein [Clostridia bacterium]